MASDSAPSTMAAGTATATARQIPRDNWPEEALTWEMTHSTAAGTTVQRATLPGAKAANSPTMAAVRAALRTDRLRSARLARPPVARPRYATPVAPLSLSVVGMNPPFQDR